MARKRLTQFQKTLRDLTCSVPEAAVILEKSETTVKQYCENHRDDIAGDQLDSYKHSGTLAADGTIVKGTWLVSVADVKRLKREIGTR